jgi:hypothetical protein
VSQIPANNQLPKNSFLTDEKPYSIENAQAVSNKIISLSKQFDADAVQVSSVPEFSLNNENCAEADASSFQNVLEDNTAFPTMESKIQYFKSNLKERKYDADVSTPKEDNIQNVIEDESSKDIHIFVPGIFGTSSHWSNDGENPSENQGFVQSKFPHRGAYEDLANSELEYQNRKKWNDCDHSSFDFTACGFSTGIQFCTYIRILFWVIKIDHSVEIDFDGLVGTGNGQGLPIESIKLNNGFFHVPVLTLLSDLREPLEVDCRKYYLINATYILGVCLKIMKNRKSSPKDPAVPHNLETMFPNAVYDIVNQA